MLKMHGLKIRPLPCFVSRVVAPLSLRTGRSALGLLHPAPARLAARPTFDGVGTRSVFNDSAFKRSFATHSTVNLASPVVPIVLTGVNFEVSTVTNMCLHRAFLFILYC